MPAQLSAPSEFTLTNGDFERIRTLIRGAAGIAIGAHKRQMVYGRIIRRLRELGLRDCSTYLDQLEGGDDSAEWQRFINLLTTNLTSFFREHHHFPVLARLAKERRGPVTVWCAAASTGEEPYSIAITLAEALGEGAASARVLATDIDTDVLATAAAGVYPVERVSALDPAQLRRFFQRGTGPRAGQVRVHPALAAMVRFSRLNLLDAQWSVKEPVDAIFCRNVMIYFDKPTQRHLLERFTQLLKPDGLLFAGHSENAALVCPAFRGVGPTVYALARREMRK